MGKQPLTVYDSAYRYATFMFGAAFVEMLIFVFVVLDPQISTPEARLNVLSVALAIFGFSLFWIQYQLMLYQMRQVEEVRQDARLDTTLLDAINALSAELRLRPQEVHYNATYSLVSIPPETSSQHS
jgi:hypothetical protein